MGCLSSENLKEEGISFSIPTLVLRRFKVNFPQSFETNIPDTHKQLPIPKSLLLFGRSAYSAVHSHTSNDLNRRKQR